MRGSGARRVAAGMLADEHLDDRVRHLRGEIRIGGLDAEWTPSTETTAARATPSASRRIRSDGESSTLYEAIAYALDDNEPDYCPEARALPDAAKA